MGQPFLNCTIAKTFSELVLGNLHDLSCEGDMTLVSFIVSFINKEIAVTKCQTISTEHLYSLFKTSKLTLYYKSYRSSNATFDICMYKSVD